MFYLCGSKKHVTQEMFTSSKRPFYQSTQVITIDAINKKKYSEFATTNFTKHDALLTNEIFESIYDKYDGHTWYVQVLLNRIYGYNRDVDAELVAYATHEIISEYSYSFVC